MDFRLATFINLCQTQSYTKTAHNLGLTQPAVSQHVRYLEEYYGVKLILYSKRQFILTEAGKYLYQHALDLLFLSNKIKKEIPRNSTPSIIIGVNPTIGDYLMPDLISGFKRQHPATRISYFTGTPEELEHKLYQGNVDLLITEHNHICPELKHTFLRSEPIDCICNPRHPFANQTVCMSEIFKEGIVFTDKTSNAYHILKSALEAYQYNLDNCNINLEMSSIPALFRYICDNSSFTFVYHCACKAYLESKRLAQIYIKDVSLDTNFYCISQRAECLTLSASQFKEYLLSSSKATDHCPT